MSDVSLVVLEVNELAPRVVDWWVRRTPEGALARLVSDGSRTVTVLSEQLPRDLYPSQSWASFNTGVPWEQHGVFWYGDPKPAAYPLYWQIAAGAGRTVGFVGTLHSSPLERLAGTPTLRFAIPDAFAESASTVPAVLRPVQDLNLRLTRQGARVAGIRPSPRDLAGLARLVTNGLRPTTTIRLGELLVRVAAGQWGRERFRCGQALLFADVFDHLVERHEPDLSILFTNHVASAMHRYWAATFPEDWGADGPYDDAWVRRYVNELPYAMTVLDRILERLLRRCHRSGHQLVITSSMGQKADDSVDTTARCQAIVKDARRFFGAVGFDRPYESVAAMVPQLGLRFPSELEAVDGRAALVEHLGNCVTDAFRSDDTVTITCQLPVVAGDVEIAGRRFAPEDCGVVIQPINDHRSGRHCPRGVLITSSRVELPPEVDAFEVAPALLVMLGVDPPSHHRSPTFSLSTPHDGTARADRAR